MLYFVCFIFGILLFFYYFCNNFTVDLFTENKEIVISEMLGKTLSDLQFASSRKAIIHPLFVRVQERF